MKTVANKHPNIYIYPIPYLLNINTYFCEVCVSSVLPVKFSLKCNKGISDRLLLQDCELAAISLPSFDRHESDMTVQKYPPLYTTQVTEAICSRGLWTYTVYLTLYELSLYRKIQ